MRSNNRCSRSTLGEDIHFIGSGQVMLGTDHPYPWQTESIDHVLATPELSDDERRAILGETACRLLGIPQ